MGINRLVLLICILLIGSCSRQVIRQPIAEIDRPLFLPPSNWQVTLGISRDKVIRGYGEDFPDYGPPFYLSPADFQFPAMRMGKHVEYQIPVALRYFIVRNTVVTDSQECITGLNIALASAIDGFQYSQRDGFEGYSSHRLLVKYPLSRFIWVEGGMRFYIPLPINHSREYKDWWKLRLPVMAGFQLTRQFSITTGALFVEDYYFGKTSSYNSNWGSSYRQYDLDLYLPTRLKFAFSRNWDLGLLVECFVHDRQNYGITGGIWGTFTW